MGDTPGWRCGRIGPEPDWHPNRSTGIWELYRSGLLSNVGTLGAQKRRAAASQRKLSRQVELAKLFRQCPVHQTGLVWQAR
jgi:hypothetical protein